MCGVIQGSREHSSSICLKTFNNVHLIQNILGRSSIHIGIHDTSNTFVCVCVQQEVALYKLPQVERGRTILV